MATAVSLILIAVGAILAIAVDYQVTGINIQAIGGILIVVGVIGLIFSLLFLASFAPFSRGDRYPEGRHHDHI